MMLTSIVFSFISKELIRRDWLPLKYSRKVFNTVGHWTAAAALIALGYVTYEQKYLAVGLLILAVGACGSAYLGYQVSVQFQV